MASNKLMFYITFLCSFSFISLSKVGERDKREEGGGGDEDGGETRREGTLMWLWGPAIRVL